MTKQKGPKRAKLEFTMKRIENKKTRHLKGADLEEALAKIAAAKKKSQTRLKLSRMMKKPKERIFSYLCRESPLEK